MLRLLGVLLIVPAISFTVARAVLYKFNSDWTSAVESEIAKTTLPEDTDSPEYEQAESAIKRMRALESIPLQTICADPKLNQLWTGCDDVAAVSLMGTASVIAGLGGLLMVCLIGAAGRLARTSRRLLLLFFRPGLYLTVVTLSALILTHAALAILSIYYGEGTLIGRIHGGIMLAIGLGAVSGTLAMIKGAFAVVRTATSRVVGKRIDLKKYPALSEFLRRLSTAIGTSMPDNVVVGLTPNFFVTEADVLCLDGTLTKRSLYLSLPLARILTKSEMASVLGHELGHYHGLDTEFSRKFYPIYRGTAQSLAALAAHVGEGARATALIPAIYALSYFYTCFSSAEAKLGRDRELVADAVGARVTTARTAAVALLKVCTFAPMWNAAIDDMKEALSEGKQFINISARWSFLVSRIEDRSIFAGSDSRQLNHPTDTHPPLGVRLGALGFAVSDLESDALKTAPADSAITLITDYEDVEKELTDVEHYLLNPSGAGADQPQSSAPG